MEQKICFLVCPIGEAGSDIRNNSDQLLKYVIEPVTESKGYNVVRADKIFDTDTITDTIMKYLDEAELIIADLSGRNPNVYYELGYRAALQKPLIQLIKCGETLPFDISVRRTFPYDLSDPDKIEEIKRTLSQLIDSVEAKRTEMAAVKMSSGMFGKEIGQVIATGMLADMAKNPQDSAKYLELIKNFGEMKKAIDEIQQTQPKD